MKQPIYIEEIDVRVDNNPEPNHAYSGETQPKKFLKMQEQQFV